MNWPIVIVILTLILFGTIFAILVMVGIMNRNRRMWVMCLVTLFGIGIALLMLCQRVAV